MHRIGCLTLRINLLRHTAICVTTEIEHTYGGSSIERKGVSIREFMSDVRQETF